MINNLIAVKSAKFFKIKKKLTNKAIEGLFTTLRKNYSVNSHNIFKYIRKKTKWNSIFINLFYI
ncbi:hypothetical protein AD953_01980 [Acetobacter malorum]|uniref:Uncharacterized protein n=1 Tax=Acetobacter malorum TaxID=178901 RepID=A0A149VH21_9PROT|nr:hypothetical protein AD953_01980 [Acetobacter malorum]